MVDQISAERRSAVMGKIKATNTGPEIRVRKAAHAVGLRFRLQRSDLPGKPDLVFPKLKTALFVHGCFWHQHQGCRRASVPKTRTEYWNEKLARNVARDAATIPALQARGWRTVTIWECETADQNALQSIIRGRLFLQCTEVSG
ncbi:T/G mismatch-specific endonuclease [Phyllobacterium sp. YR620]|uniref:very short patch repair endonuclease n=1 Tax=Phyllobacterium sp. YR620 TaxID=1881066 RepID=UPI000885F54D|nr:very short patch repair endonuclease [Phyllobacterium sp. YR620]SDP58581.1 T/G mismatch-specific endonuclease [Phyllobacterium sp. YR620]